MLFEQVGIEDRDDFFLTHEIAWRNTERACEVIFGKIHTLPDSSLEAAGTDWKLLIDFPFDEVGRSPQEDFERPGQVPPGAPPAGRGPLCWVPSFFKPSARRTWETW